jgi:hypothetical protein
VAYQFAARALPAGLRLLPLSGVVPPQSHALVALRWSAPPGGAASLRAELPVTFNGSAADTARLLVTGASHVPAVATSLGGPGGGALFLRPTCAGSSSARSLEVVNPGRVPAAWRWAVPAQLAGVVAFEPAVRRGRGA